MSYENNWLNIFYMFVVMKSFVFHVQRLLADDDYLNERNANEYDAL